MVCITLAVVRTFRIFCHAPAAPLSCGIVCALGDDGDEGQQTGAASQEAPWRGRGVGTGDQGPGTGKNIESTNDATHV